MFVILITYKKPIEAVEQYLKAHRTFLDEGYKKNYFIASGPKKPRTGGVIISQLTDKNELEKILNQDPFHIYGIADYEFIEFNPIRYHHEFECFINKKATE